MTRHVVDEGTLTECPTHKPLKVNDRPVTLAFRASPTPEAPVYVHYGAGGPILGVIIHQGREDRLTGRQRGDSEVGWAWSLEGEYHNVGHDTGGEWLYASAREAIEALIDTWPVYARLNKLPREMPRIVLSDVVA